MYYGTILSELSDSSRKNFSKCSTGFIQLLWVRRLVYLKATSKYLSEGEAVESGDSRLEIKFDTERAQLLYAKVSRIGKSYHKI